MSDDIRYSDWEEEEKQREYEREKELDVMARRIDKVIKKELDDANCTVSEVMNHLLDKYGLWTRITSDYGFSRMTLEDFKVVNGARYLFMP